MFTQIANKIQHQLVTKAPKVLTYPSQFLPFLIQQKCLSEILSRVFKEAIEDGDLDFLQGKWLKVTVSDLKLTWLLSFENGAFIIKAQAPNTDVSFSASVNGSNSASYIMVPNSGFSTLSPFLILSLFMRSCLAHSKSYSLKFCLSALELKPLKVTFLLLRFDPLPLPYAISSIS